MSVAFGPAVFCAWAASAAALFADAAGSPGSGRLGATGSPMVAGLMQRWTEACQKKYPGADIAFTSAAAAAPADRVALGPGLEEIFHNDHSRYIEKNLREPFRVEVALGSFSTKGKVQATGVFVNRDNPLNRLTLAQLDAVFSTTRRRGHTGDLATWGDLGLTDEWTVQPIRL